jgi:hypothetical protein
MRILKPLFAMLLLLCLNTGFAQIESSKNTQLADTCVPASVDDYNRLIKYFMAEKEETKQLFKFDLIQYALFRPNIAYETRIKNNLNAEFAFLFDIGKHPGAPQDWAPLYYLFAPTADLKYYHNINLRKTKGKTTNGFSGNYFSAGLGAYVYEYDPKSFYEGPDGKLIQKYTYFGDFNNHLPYNEPNEPEITENIIVWRNKKYAPNESVGFVRIGYGIQRRIGNIGYVATDFNFGLGTNHEFTRLYLMPELSIKAGFAISSFNKK